MRIFVIALAVIAATSAASISSEYLPPVVDNSLSPSLEYLAPEDQTALADDGYRYKTVRKLRLRHRRDVSEIVNQEYLPPTEESSDIAEVPEEKTVLADDGYRYKTVHRLKYRHRRDVNELPSNEYLPAAEESSDVAEVETPEEKTVLAEDGYRYKTVRRLKYRHRRDVNELPSNEYLPAAEESSDVTEAETPEEKTVLADDGYRYKTVRRLKYRHRRDVNELPSNEYLPAAEESSDVAEVETPEEKTVLAEDGYRYKTVRRLKYRHRRDVNELPSNEYLPAAEESSDVTEAETPEDKTVLADDGYRYKTVRRLKYRHRRDVNELPSNEYLPAAEESSDVAEVETPEEKTVLAEDGYRYKTVRRLKYRHRRDVNELPSNEYLPAAEESSDVAEVETPEEKTVLAEDGYRYKTVLRLKYRHRRDVNELPSNEYLPAAEESSDVAEVETPEEKTVLAEDGYRYKTVRRLKYRHRRDVNELPSNEYLPAAEESSDVAEVETPEEKTVLAEDGYRYKTVRRLKYRHRRDVNELPSNEYLPAAEESSDVAEVETPEEKTVLAEDGYRYKTVRRLKYRHRRDVNELPSNEYLPAAEDSSDVAEVEIPEEKTVLADDGYRYKVVRRLKYRHRRDVNELPSNEYLPAAEESSEVETPEEKTVLADDGYRYKTVRRLKYRHRN